MTRNRRRSIVIATIILAVLGLLVIQQRQARRPEAAALVWISPPEAQHAWQALGPGGGGHIDVFAFSPDYTFAGTDTGGVMRSADHGATWLPVNRGLYDYPVSDLAVDRVNPEVLYATTPGGIYKSQNSGDHWQLLQDGFPEKDLHAYSAPLACVTIDPSDSRVLYVGAGRLFKRIASEGTGNVYKSVDGGTHWTRYNIGHPQAIVYDLAVDPAVGATVYAATDQGFFVSADAGQSWQQIDTLDSRGLAVGRDPTSQTTIIYRTAWQQGVFKSEDAGQSWTRLDGLQCNACDYRSIVIHPSDPNVVVMGDYGANSRNGAGVYRTIDGGASWQKLNGFSDLGWRASPSPLARGLGMNPFDPDELFVSSMMVAYRRYDQGSWEQIITNKVDRVGGTSTRWPGRWASRLGNNNTVVNTRPVFHPSRHDTYLLGYSDLYIWRTDDNGKSWQNIQTPGENDIRSLVADPNDDDFLTWFAGDSPQDCCGGSFYKTIDSGRNWLQATGLPDNRVWHTVVTPENSNVVYVATQDFGVFRSTNGGASFEPRSGDGASRLPKGRIYTIVMDQDDPDTLFVPVSGDDGGVFRSTDGGESWVQVGEMQGCTTVTMSTLNRAVYAGCSDQVFRSDDGGDSWVPVYGGGTHPAHPGQPWAGYVADIAPHPTDPDVLCFVIKDDTYHDQSSGRGLFCTDDGGSHWEEIADPLGLVLRGTRVAFHPLPDPQTGAHDLFYMTGGGGAYRIDGAPFRK